MMWMVQCEEGHTDTQGACGDWSQQETLEKLYKNKLPESLLIGKENSESCFQTPPSKRRMLVIPWTSVRPRCPSTESNDSIDSELNHFRPIKTAPLSPPKKLEDGSSVSLTVVRARPRVRTGIRKTKEDFPPPVQISPGLIPASYSSQSAANVSPSQTPSLVCEEYLPVSPNMEYLSEDNMKDTRCSLTKEKSTVEITETKVETEHTQCVSKHRRKRDR